MGLNISKKNEIKCFINDTMDGVLYVIPTCEKPLKVLFENEEDIDVVYGNFNGSSGDDAGWDGE